LYLANGYIREAIELVIFCDYLEGFKLLMENKSARVSTVFYWRYLFRKLTESYRSNMEQPDLPPRSLTISELLPVMMESIGPTPAADILLEFHKEYQAMLQSHPQHKKNDIAISTIIYKNLLALGRKELTKTGLVHETLEILASYLWSQKPPALGPQFRSIETLELNDNRIDDHNLDEVPFLYNNELSISASLGSPQEMSPELNFDYSEPCPRFFEELNSHWGVTATLSHGICPVCCLPIKQRLGEDKVVVFPHCGHGYHERCVESDSCTVCLVESLDSLVPIDV